MVDDAKRRPAGQLDGPGTGAEPTPPIAREITRFDNMSTQQLVDVMITCGHLLATRRKQP